MTKRQNQKGKCEQIEQIERGDKQKQSKHIKQRANAKKEQMKTNRTKRKC